MMNSRSRHTLDPARNIEVVWLWPAGEGGHHCHARMCSRPCPPERLMCPGHWFRVPRDLQDRVWATYRRGQCDDKQPSEAWHKAADAAISAVWKLEMEAIAKFEAFIFERAPEAVEDWAGFVHLTMTVSLKNACRALGANIAVGTVIGERQLVLTVTPKPNGRGRGRGARRPSYALG
jgi:hypothetical protein